MQHRDLPFAKRYLFYSMVTITLVLAGVFFSYHERTERLITQVLLQQARALFSELITTRRWVSSHGGVFVKVGPGVDPNPFLSSLPGLKVNIKDEDGTLYTLRNPGLVVRGISDIAEESGSFRFHVASLNPVNPINSTPDEFEKKALQGFELREKESVTIEKGDDGPVYRFMAPLFFEEKCNKCHGFQNYKPGDIRGGISISIPMSEVAKKIKENRLFSLYSGGLVLSILFIIPSLLTSKFMRKLRGAQEELVLLAATDPHTKLYNRRSAFERLEEEISKNRRYETPLSCMMLDVDLFKSVNDKYGHLGGDRVLVQFADTLRHFTRQYDILCRYGGEEFLVILPGTDMATATTVAEKLRAKISECVVTFHRQEIRITTSIGVAEANLGLPEGIDSIIGRADDALYKAKELGRNRVVAAEG